MFKILWSCLFIVYAWGSETIIEPIHYADGTIDKELINERVKGSHIKVFMPSIPYHYISKLINGTLLRIADTPQGWEYMMATEYIQIDDVTYEFALRQGVKFQDGTDFNADSVVHNFNAFLKNPYTYTDIHNRLKSVEKINPYRVRFHLYKPYGMFLHDLAAINLYSDTYLQKFTWQGGATGANTQEAGNYGLGPYILTQGYAIGRKQTPIITLKANPFYYKSTQPYIETITIYTQLTADESVKMALDKEGELDITPIPFNKKTEATLSPYAKLLTMPSTNNIMIYFNLMNKKSVLNRKEVRIALNKAINQPRLLNFVYKNEGQLAPTEASTNYQSVKEASQTLKTYGETILEQEKEEIKTILSGITLNVLTQDRFMFLWKGIEYQLNQFGVQLNYTVTTSEKDIYEQLLTNREEPKAWDLLTWGNDDWFGNHPWTTFFAYRTTSEWSSIEKDDILQNEIEAFFSYPFQSSHFQQSVDKIVHHVYDNAYMLFIPSPNIVLAINKEVSYVPSSVAIMPLWEAKISKNHWSVRKGSYAPEKLLPMKPLKVIK